MERSAGSRRPSRAERLWWLYVLGGFLVLAWAGYLAVHRGPGWGVEVALFGLLGVCNVAVGGIWWWQRRSRRHVGQPGRQHD